MILFFLLRASVSRILFQFQTESRLTLCGSALAYCADACEEGKQNFLPTKKRSIYR
jgi:hypothetical protein